jgi:hypothetical protein
MKILQVARELVLLPAFSREKAAEGLTRIKE